MLRRVLPVLLRTDAPFKVAASLEVLDSLNQGAAGLSQTGKFITVYPNSDAQAVQLAVALDEATRGLIGPPILSDRPLSPGSLVHYRYGGFGERSEETPHGDIQPVISTPNGGKIADRRSAAYRPPEWAADPFVAAGVAAELPSSNRLVGGRYLILVTPYRSPGGAVHRAVDLVKFRRCVLKQAHRGGIAHLDGRDARDYLRHEADVLASLVPDPRFPAPLGVIEQDGDLFLVMELLEGETLREHVARRSQTGRIVPAEQIIAWGRELAAAIETVHSKGLVHRDLTAGNVILGIDGRLRLIDFGLACALPNDGVPTYSQGGTRGYMSPQQAAGQPPAVTDDVYSLGALLYFLSTCCEPTFAPKPFDLMDRPITLLNPSVGPALEQTIVRCLDPDPTARFPSMDALNAALTANAGRAVRTPVPYGEEPPAESEKDTQSRYKNLASQLGDSLCQALGTWTSGQEQAWITGVEHSRYLCNGSAGAMLALAELVEELRIAQHRAVLAEAASWLVTAPHLGAQPLPGFYVGEAGVGAALLRAGQVLGDGDLIAVAADRGRWVASLPYASPDLWDGTAGRLRFHLLLWDETADPGHLRHAIEAGESLLKAAEDAGDGGLCWRTPPGYGTASGSVPLGYAHGAAGIADALLDLFEATEDERFLAAAQAAGHWLARLAVPVLDDESGLDWPDVEGNPPFGGVWCHGATGVGRFLLHIAQLGALSGAGDLAARAARMVARGARSVGPTQCHGLAGNIEFLLDMSQATGDRTYLAEVRSLARLLEAFGQERDGSLVWPSDAPEQFTPSYLTGYAGVAVCLLRLTGPEHLPHQLSRRGFRYRRASSAGAIGTNKQISRKPE